MTEQIRLCLPARWGGIRSATALRISHYDKQGHVVGRLPISEKKNHWPFGNQIFYPNGQWWHIPEKSPLASAICSQVTDTPAAVLLGKMATGHDRERTRDERLRDKRPAGPRGPQRPGYRGHLRYRPGSGRRARPAWRRDRRA